MKLNPNFPHAYVNESVIIGAEVNIFPGAVVGRDLINSQSTFRHIDVGSIKSLTLCDKVIVGSNAVIYNGSFIGIGSMICDTACIRENVIVGDNSLIAMGVTINTNTHIGSGVKIMDNTHVTGNATIEDDVFIGMLVTMANDNNMGGSKQSIEEMKGPHIKKGARIGQGACLYPGVTIGENAVVGTNSVVTKDIPDNSLAIGMPARIVKTV